MCRILSPPTLAWGTFWNPAAKASTPAPGNHRAHVLGRHRKSSLLNLWKGSSSRTLEKAVGKEGYLCSHDCLIFPCLTKHTPSRPLATGWGPFWVRKKALDRKPILDSSWWWKTLTNVDSCGSVLAGRGPPDADTPPSLREGSEWAPDKRIEESRMTMNFFFQFSFLAN